MRALAALVPLALVLAVTACGGGDNRHPTQGEMEAELVCPTCHEPLDESNSPVARQMKLYIATRIKQGATKQQIEDELVGPPNNLGKAVLGVPGTHGFDLLAWVLPFSGIAFGAVALGAGAWYWSRSRKRGGEEPPSEDEPPLDPELERRVDEELARFDA